MVRLYNYSSKMKLNALSCMQNREKKQPPHTQKSSCQHKDACGYQSSQGHSLSPIALDHHFLLLCSYIHHWTILMKYVFLSIKSFHLVTPIPVCWKLSLALAISQLSLSFPKFWSHS